MLRVLVLGGTGAMGVYLVPELLNMGFGVTVSSRRFISSDNARLSYIQGNPHDKKFITRVLEEGRFDAVVDFMLYATSDFRDKYELLLNNTKHYIFLSSYRVFAESSVPITEESPRLLDVSADSEYLKTDGYALSKARQENILQKSLFNNWTIVRPSITYSKMRFQLSTLEADTIIFRALNSLPVILPKEMLQKHATMTWAGDTARMIAGIVLNSATYCESYNVCTSEHQTWEKISSYYRKFIGLKIVHTNIDDYIATVHNKYQVLYDRMYSRFMDNSKIMQLTNMKRGSLMTVRDGLELELSNIDEITQSIRTNYVINAGIDRLIRTKTPLRGASLKDLSRYYSSYIGVYPIVKNVKSKLFSQVRLI